MTDSFDIRNSAFGIRPVPPKGNANFAWVQHFIHHLAPQGVPAEARATIRKHRIVRFERSTP